MKGLQLEPLMRLCECLITIHNPLFHLEGLDALLKEEKGVFYPF